jgi:hypothetical protein
LTNDLIKKEYKIKIKELETMLATGKPIRFTELLVRNLWDTFKVEPNDESPFGERFVLVKDLVSRKINRKGKRIDELIQLQRSADKQKADSKLKGL